MSNDCKIYGKTFFADNETIKIKPLKIERIYKTAMVTVYQ